MSLNAGASTYDETTTFVRRDVWTLLADDPWDPVTVAYAQAVAAMQARPATDPTSWTYQSAIHGAYAAPPPGARWNECQHQSWYFLSWHRMYLYYFERIARAAVVSAYGPSDFALPYWNYDQPFPANTLPRPFREPTLPDGSANPLFLPPPQRRSDIVNGFQLSPLVTSSSAAMAMTNFIGPPGAGFGGGRRPPAQFGGSVGGLEQTPHNGIHVQVGGVGSGQCQGGLMIDPFCAALDPIFWLHHANVDRLWNQWLALGDGRANPSDAAWLDQPFTFHDETGAAVTLTGAQVVDSAAQLHYRYDTEPSVPELAISMSGGPTPPHASEPPELVAATQRPLELTGSARSVELAAPASTRSLLASEDVTTGARAVYLNVEDIEAERNPGIVYGVFIDMPSDDPAADHARYHVGNIALFGIEAMNDPDATHGGVPGFRHTFDITGVVGELSEAGEWDPNSIRVTFEPIPLIPPPGEEGRMGAVAEEADGPPVRIGRVSLFVG
ncbi:MAG: tyrosinase family protein [Pseudonocardiaceae bacterium]